MQNIGLPLKGAVKVQYRITRPRLQCLICKLNVSCPLVNLTCTWRNEAFFEKFSFQWPWNCPVPWFTSALADQVNGHSWVAIIMRLQFVNMTEWLLFLFLFLYLPCNLQAMVFASSHDMLKASDLEVGTLLYVLETQTLWIQSTSGFTRLAAAKVDKHRNTIDNLAVQG